MSGIKKAEPGHAIVFVSSGCGRETDVYRALKKYQEKSPDKNFEVADIEPLFGEYNYGVFIKGYYNSLPDFIVNYIRSIDGVIDTKTHTGYKHLEKNWTKRQ